MKRNILIWMLFTTFITTFAQQGTILEGQRVYSRHLTYDVNYAVYLPPGYNDTERRYPVVYLLHGYTDDETAWIQFGEIQNSADKGINEGVIPPMIIVMPDAKGTWYINNFDGSEAYEDFFIEEFIQHIDKTFRTRADKEFRAVSGLSMGGYGSLIYTMKHPDLFSSCAAFSASHYSNEEMIGFDQEYVDRVWGTVFGKGLKGKERLTPHFFENQILNIAEKSPAENLKKVKFYLDCGDDDFRVNSNVKLHKILVDKGVTCELRVRNGGHSWSYWRNNIIEGLKFIGSQFHR